MRGSHPNLKLLETKPSIKPAAVVNVKTNLNTIGRNLKGSYTSLKPMNTNLPVAPPLDSTVTVTKVQVRFFNVILL